MTDKIRLDKFLVQKGLVPTRSQAEQEIEFGNVFVNGRVKVKPGFLVGPEDKVKVVNTNPYVSRAGLKLASIAEALELEFKDAAVLDVGSSTGGFTDYALQHGAKRVYAVDVGTNQLHPRLRADNRIELHEKTDIRDIGTVTHIPVPDIIVIDVSFISLREILPHIAKSIAGEKTRIAAMVKPQFEAGRDQVSKGVIKNDTVRRQILKDFEQWSKQLFIIKNKADSEIAGSTGNRERFYLLKLSK